MDIFDITASGLTAQRLRMDTISSNLANVNSTRNEQGQLAVYKRKNVVFAPIYESAMNRMGSTGGAPFMGNVMGGGASGSSFAGPSFSAPHDGVTVGPDGHIQLNLSASTGGPATAGAGVQVMQITDDTNAPTMKIHAPDYAGADANGDIEVPADCRMVYDPSNPDSIKEGPKAGYVIYPNVNVVTEMVDMISASRAYEANVTALQSAKSMAQSALEM